MIEQITGRIAYPGLRPFTRDEFDLFFGRENCVDQMVDTLAASRFLAVLGTSGSGKSSLVRTGLLNALELGFLASAGSDWQIADLRPRGHPIRSLAVALLDLQGETEPDEGEIEILSSFLRRGPRSLVEWYQAGHLPEGANLLILVDQFEELFRYEDYSGREEAEAFVALLIEAARETELPLHVVITMRSEYLGACTLIEALPDFINRGLYLTPRMTREECRQAIDGPAGVCGFEIEDALINRLLNDLTDFAPWEAGGGHDQRRRLGRRADQLPLMQHVLNLLWQRARSRSEENIVLTLADYDAAGHLGGALDKHADEVAAGIDPAHADIIDTVFRSLVTGRTVIDAVRRPTRFGELVELAGDRRESVAAVIEAFRVPGVNFLTPEAPEAIHDDTFIDISHESLIRQWRRLSRCLDDEAQSADAWNQLLSRAERFAAGSGGLLADLDLDNLVAWWRRTNPTQAWAARYGNNFDEARQFLEDSQTAETERKHREEDDQRKLIEAEEAARTGGRFKRLSGALAAAVVLAAVGAGAALYLWREANQQATIATEQATIADEQRQEAERQRQLADGQREEAEKQRQRAEEQAALAQREQVEAERLRVVAEQKAQEAAASAVEAKLAQEEASRANAKLIAQQFAGRIGTFHVGVEQSTSAIPTAGSLLSRAAESAYVNDTSEATVENLATVELLRPALAFQATLANATLPEMKLPGWGDVTRWRNPPGGLTVVIDWSEVDNDTPFYRIVDILGRVIARYPLPDSPTTYEKTPVAAALIGPDIPAGFIATGDGNIWAAFGERGDFNRYTDGSEGETERIDDVRYDPVGERLYIAYVAKASDGTSSVPRAMILDRDGDDWSTWSKVVDLELAAPMIGVPPVWIAGIADKALYVVVDNQLTGITASGDHMPFGGLGKVEDAIVTVDGRYIAVQAMAEDCANPAAGAMLNPVACLFLVDRADGEILWRGETQPRIRLQTAHSVGGTNPSIEVVVEIASDGTTHAPGAPWVLNDLWTRKLARVNGEWTDTLKRFDPQEWGTEGFGTPYATVAATGTGYPSSLTREHVAQLFAARALPRIAKFDPRVAPGVDVANTILANHVDDDSFRVVHITEKEAQVYLYRPEIGGFVVDETYTPVPIFCRAGPDKTLGECTFVSAAFSPDGETLLLTTNHGEHAFVQRGGEVEWQPSTLGDDSSRRINALSQLAPLDEAGSAFLARGSSGDLLRIRQDAGEAGSIDPVLAADDLWQDIGELDAFTTDPSTGALYVWGNTGLLILGLTGDDALAIERLGHIENNAIADVAALNDGTFAIASSDGRITLHRIEDGEAVEFGRVETGLSSFGAIRLSVANGGMVANAGDDREGLDYWKRSVGYTIEDGKLTQTFAVPWINLVGQLGNGSAVSVDYGPEVFVEPSSLPPDQDLLALTIMREQRSPDDAASQFQNVFQMLGKRPGGGAGAGDQPACRTALAVMARAGDSSEFGDTLNTARRACRMSPDGQALADAANAEGRAGIMALLRLAPSDPYALARLVADLSKAAPAAAAALEAHDPRLATFPTETLVQQLTTGAPMPEALAAAYEGTAGGYDPFDHWLLAVIAEQAVPDKETLAEALFHYARAESLFTLAGGAQSRIPEPISARRAGLARVLADDVVVDVYRRLTTEAPAETPASEGPASLRDVAAWLAGIEAAGAEPQALLLLKAIVEEELGDSLASADTEAAAAHYREALRMVVQTEMTLSEEGGIAGRLADVEQLGEKLRAIGAADADAAEAAAVVTVIDSEMDVPITANAALRETLRRAIEQLAASDPAIIDFTSLQDLRFDFWDYDWQSRAANVSGGSAPDFLEELVAAEAFVSAMLDHVGPDHDRLSAVRGRLRFWLSTLSSEDMPSRDPAEFDRWLDGAMADFESVDPASLFAWDAGLLGAAHGYELARAPVGADIAPVLARSLEAFERAIAAPTFSEIGDYRRRLVLDGAVRVLDDALTRVLESPRLSGFGPNPGDPDFDRDQVADFALAAFSFADLRETFRDRADELGLLRDGSGWPLDTAADYYWGFAAAEAGALLRIADGTNGPATGCDRVAAHPHDVTRTTAPVDFSDIDVGVVLAACTGDTPREMFNRARGIGKSSEPDQATILKFLIPAAEAGLPVAYNNLAIMIEALRPDFVSPGDLRTTYSALSLKSAYGALSNLLRPMATDESRETFAWLAAKAATLDVAEAHRDLADLLADDLLARGMHLAVAEELFAAEGRNAEADAAGASLAALDLTSDEIVAVRQAASSRERMPLVLVDQTLADQLLGLW